MESTRKSNRVCNGSIAWCDSQETLHINAIIDDLLTTCNNWNLYVTNEGNCRHAFVVNKNTTIKTFFIYDYQGISILESPHFCTTKLYYALKKSSKTSNGHGYKVLFGQKHCIEGNDYSHLCMKNSAFVMKYHVAPKDNKFNCPYEDTESVLIDLTNSSDVSIIGKKRSIIDLTDI